jgi:CRP-like cAMP-binding protein
MLRKLELWKGLGPDERAAVLALPHTIERAPAGRYLIREGDRPKHTCLIVSGFAFRHKVTGEGARSINAIHFAGDMVDLQNSLLQYADHSVQTLTQATVAYIPVESIIDLAFSYPQIGLAMWYDTLVDGSIFREWIANTTRRTAPARLSHVLCELGVRMEAMGLAERDEFELPMSQEQFADATGLTSVHVNRTLKELEAQGLFTRNNRHVHVGDWSKLAAAGDFSDSYLHLDRRQAASR